MCHVVVIMSVQCAPSSSYHHHHHHLYVDIGSVSAASCIVYYALLSHLCLFCGFWHGNKRCATANVAHVYIICGVTLTGTCYLWCVR